MSAEKPISRVAGLRAKAGLTQLELAQQVGVTETTISNWEKGRSGTDWFERIIRLCKALQCSAEDLLEYQAITASNGPQADGLSLPEVQALVRSVQPSNAPPIAQHFSMNPAENSVSNCQEERLQK